jgi:hypothetical protein
MSVSLTVQCSDIEYKALQHYMADVQEWLQLTLTGRAGVAVDDLVKSEMARMLSEPSVTSIPADKNTIVMNAPFIENNPSTPPLQNSPPVPPS